MKKFLAVAVSVVAAISVAACGSTGSHTSTTTKTVASTTPTTQTQAKVAVTAPKVKPDNTAECSVLKYDWNRTRTHLQAEDYSYVAGGWMAIGKDFQALGMLRDARASMIAGGIFLDVAEGQTMTNKQLNTFASDIKQINIDGNGKCGSL
jgi:hypothetical protein